jgi:rSAM/selenodomain-associated transferase 2
VSISVIIPALNEAEHIQKSIETVTKHDRAGLVKEIIVIDGNSNDDTVTQAQKAGATVIHSTVPGRAIQMNLGAHHARSEVLFFLHADTLVPDGFSTSIKESIDQGYPAGCFRLSFDHPSPILRFYAWLTRFKMDIMRYGDQGLYINSALFMQSGGFKEDHRVLEDNEFTRRIRSTGIPFKVLKQAAITSARRYLEQGTIRLQLLFTTIYLMWRLGFSQDQMIAFYRKRVKNRVPI